MTANKPFIFKLPTYNIDEKDNTFTRSITIPHPLLSLGFHSFFHRTRSAMSITKKLETKNKFYYVVNPYEHIINNYENDLLHESEKILDNPHVFSRTFYKSWEILYLFDLLNKDQVVIGMSAINFLQGFLEFKQKYYPSLKVKIVSANSSENKEMVDKLNKRHNNVISMRTTDLPKADLVIADGEIEWINENYQEQEAYNLIIDEIIIGLTNQANGGTFILKIFDTYTYVTIKLIMLMTALYEEVYIYKPYFSRFTNGEKYLICKKFKGSKHLDTILTTLRNVTSRKMPYLCDIFTKTILTNEQLNIFKYINVTIANLQQIMINKIVVYIKSNNYFGDLYHQYRDEQIKATKWWIENFYTSKLTNKSQVIADVISYNDSELKLFIQKLI